MTCDLRPATCVAFPLCVLCVFVVRLFHHKDTKACHPPALSDPVFFAGRKVPALGDALVRQPLLAVERGHAAGAGRGDGLAVDVIDGVAAGEDALDVRRRRMRMRQADVAALVELELPRVRLRVRRVADGDEEALRGEVASPRSSSDCEA